MKNLFIAMTVTVLALPLANANEEESTHSLNKIVVQCPAPNQPVDTNMWPATFKGGLWYTGAGSRVRGVITVEVHKAGGVEVFKDVPVEGLFSDELDYKLLDLGVAKNGSPILDHPLGAIQVNDVSPWYSVVAYRDGQRYIANCLGGITN